MRLAATILGLTLLLPQCDAAEPLADCPEKKAPPVVAYPSSSLDWTIYVRQNDADDNWSSSIFAKSRAGEIIDLPKAETHGEVTVRWFSTELAQIAWPCGMGSVATTFMDSHGRLSRTSYWPLAVDASRKVIAESSADEENTVDVTAEVKMIP